MHRALFASAITLICGAAACSDESTDGASGAAGSAGASGSGASGGSAGSTDGGGSSAGGNGAAAGSGAGGAGATAGSGGSGGSDLGPIPYTCANMPPTRAIGNWDVVPHQRLDGPFEVGVVAFHEEGVDVVFKLNGNELARVEYPTLNPRTGVWEYWFTFDPALVSDGPFELDATLVPDCPGHLPRDLAPKPLVSNGSATLGNPAVMHVDCNTGSAGGDGSVGSPYATIEQGLHAAGDGGTVVLEAGTCYTLTGDLTGRSPVTWTTVRAADGLMATDVVVTTSSDTVDNRFGEDLVKWTNVSLVEDDPEGYSTFFYLESNHRVWFDGADLSDKRGQWSGGNLLGGNKPYSAYYTDCVIHDVQNAGFGFGRGNTLRDIGSDVFRASSGLTAINTTIIGIDRGTTSAHPDFFQLYSPGGSVENLVFYNTEVLNMGAQGIFGGTGSLKDAAFVNLVMEKDPPDSALISQVSNAWDHVLLWHVTTVDSGCLIRGETDGLTNFIVQNNVMAGLNHEDDSPLPGWTIRHNHFNRLAHNQSAALGAPATVGDPMFTDPAMDDYGLSPASPGHAAGIPIPGVPTDVNGRAYDRTAPNLGAYAAQ